MLEIKSRKATPMDDDEELERLMAKACSAPRGSRQRNKCLTRVVELVQQSNRLRRYHSPCYQDALQETWFRVFRTPESYNPEKGTVIQWINGNLKYRYMDEMSNNNDPPRMQHPAEYYYNSLENIPDRPSMPDMLEKTWHWIQTDPQKVLRNTHLRSRSDVNAQLLLSERFPPETKWDLLVKKLNIPRTTLYKFYREKCLPLLRAFGSEQGYL